MQLHMQPDWTICNDVRKNFLLTVSPIFVILENILSGERKPKLYRGHYPVFAKSPIG